MLPTAMTLIEGACVNNHVHSSLLLSLLSRRCSVLLYLFLNIESGNRNVKNTCLLYIDCRLQFVLTAPNDFIIRRGITHLYLGSFDAMAFSFCFLAFLMDSLNLYSD